MTLNTTTPLKELTLFWPENIKTLCMEEKDKARIEEYIKKRSKEFLTVSHKVIFKKTTKENILPRTLIYDPSNSSVVMKLGTQGGMEPIGKGGERVVKAGYDLTRKKLIAYKKITPREASIYTLLSEVKIDGLPKIFSIFKYRKGTETRHCLIEKRYSGDIKHLLRNQIEVTDIEIASLFKQIATGLSFLHSRELSVSNGKKEISIPLFHGDITLKNILYAKKKDGSLIATLEDFGFAGKIFHSYGTYGLISPEIVTAYKNIHALPNKKEKDKETQRINSTYGRSRDIWGLGLVLVSLLRNEKKNPFVGLKCLATKLPKDQHILNTPVLSQDEIDAEIDAEIASLQDESQNRKKYLWQLAKKILQVNPLHRLSSKEILLNLEKNIE